MSQIKFRTTLNNKPVEVMGGWDNPLRFYHLTVFNLDPEAEEETIWCELDHYDFSQLHTIDPLKEELAKLGITPPDGFWERVSTKADGSYMSSYQDGHWTR